MSNLENSRTPQLSEVIEAGVEYVMSERYYFLPARIVKYDVGPPQIATVEVMVKQPVIFEDAQEDVEEFPHLQDLPVLFPHFGNYFISFPFQIGDFVAVQIPDLSTDQYMSGGGEVTDPVDPRRNDLSDAVVIPLAFSPLGSHINQAHASDFVIGVDNDGMQMHFSDSGSITVTHNGDDAFKLEGTGASAEVAIGAADVHAVIAEHLETFWSSLQTGFGLHTHPTGVGPSGTPLPPLPALPPNIKSNKLSFPDGS